jgi:putative methionine-R-sulfoxide reductase with GAF domain
MQLAALLEGESDPIANAANTAALIYDGLTDLNWAGFYFARPLHNPSAAYPHPFPPLQAGEGDQNAGFPAPSAQARNAEAPAAPWPPPLPGSGSGITGEDSPSLPLPLAGEGRGGGRHASGLRELVLGPFQGKPACVRIPWGQGVCGTAAASGASVIVPDVHEFPGHIACDPASRSELVVPLARGGDIIGVLDLDSPLPARFDEADRAGVERLAAILIASLDPE